MPINHVQDVADARQGGCSMIIKMDQHSLAASDAMKVASVPVAMEGRNTAKVDGMTTEGLVQAEFGKHKNQMTTGTYAEEMAKQVDVKDIKSDLDVMDPANFISQCMTGEDAHDLSEEKTPLEEYTASSMERALVRVKEQRSERNESVEAEAAKLRETERQIREKSEEIAQDSQLLAQMSQALAFSELPVREASLHDLKQAMDMTAGVQAFGDVSMQYMVANESKVTPKSIQDSLYGSGTVMIGKSDKGATESAVASGEGTEDAGVLAQPDASRADGFEELRPQIAERLGENRATVKDTQLDTARWLYQQDLPVTKESVAMVDTVKELREMDTETLLARLVSEMEDGVTAENADLSHMSKEEIQDLVDRLVNTDEATVRRTYPEDPVTARRQLEEIRLTMTVAAAREMNKLGVTIDIGNLEEMVEQLRSFEQKAKESLFEETMLAPTDFNRTVFGTTMDAAETVLGAPVELLSYTFENRQTITLESLAMEGRSLAAGYIQQAGDATDDGSGSAVVPTPVQREVYQRMERIYEAVGTEVRSDLGDSIRKAFGNMGSMLDELGLPHTAENERAVRILGYNRMEITEESIREMQTYDNRVNHLMDAMKPQVVRRMIEDNINPLELSLDQLEEQVDRILDEVGSEDIAFSRFLWKLDKQKAVTPEERESMIGIYRLLDKIEKSDGAVIGQLVQEGRDLSLKNMLEATRTRRRGHVDATVSDEAGATESRSRGSSIDSQILSAFTASEMPILKEVLSPKAMAAFTGDIENMTPEELLAFCEEHGESEEEMTPYYEETADELRRFMEEADAQAETFLRELEMPDTIRNRMSAHDFIRRQMREVRDLWTEEESDEVVDSFDEPEELEGVYEGIEKTHRELLENRKEMDDISFDGIKAQARMAGHISFFHSIRRYRMYEVPVETSQGVLDCNITIRDGAAQSERGTVEITVDSDSLGRLQATFKVSGTPVNGFVTAERQDSIGVYQELLGRVEKGFEEIGFTMDGNRLIQGNRNSLRAGDSAEGTTNQDLYRIAKSFLQNVKQI